MTPFQKDLKKFGDDFIQWWNETTCYFYGHRVDKNTKWITWDNGFEEYAPCSRCDEDVFRYILNANEE